MRPGLHLRVQHFNYNGQVTRGARTEEASFNLKNYYGEAMLNMSIEERESTSLLTIKRDEQTLIVFEDDRAVKPRDRRTISPDELKTKLELTIVKHKQAGGKRTQSLARGLVWEHQVKFEAEVEKLRRSLLKLEYLARLYLVADEIREQHTQEC